MMKDPHLTASMDEALALLSAYLQERIVPHLRHVTDAIRGGLAAVAGRQCRVQQQVGLSAHPLVHRASGVL